MPTSQTLRRPKAVRIASSSQAAAEPTSDALSQMGGNVKKKEQTMQDTVVPIFEEYKAPPKNPPRTLPKENKEKEPERPLTKAEIKRRKKQDKIDAKFKKDLAKRGF